MNDLKTWKIIFEVRYPTAALLLDHRGKIASQWQWSHDLSEWRIANNQVFIHNKSGTIVLIAGLRGLSVTMELPESHDIFNSLAVDFASSVLTLLEIKSLDRVGFRTIQIAPRKHFKLLASKMTQNLYGLSDEDWKIFGGPPEDIGFPLILKLGENRANFNAGPMRDTQLGNLFESPTVKAKLPKAVLSVDFDIFQDNPRFIPANAHKDFSNFLKTGMRQVLDISEKFMERYGAFQ
jgi:hypothetical protein